MKASCGCRGSCWLVSSLGGPLAALLSESHPPGGPEAACYWTGQHWTGTRVSELPKARAYIFATARKRVANRVGSLLIMDGPVTKVGGG